MKKYSIGEVGKLLNLKPHVVRYWEKVFPFLKPTRTFTGRRVYGESELQLFFRLRYLLNERKMCPEDAAKKMWEEFAGRKIDARLSIREIRGELLDILDRVNRLKTDGRR